MRSIALRVIPIVFVAATAFVGGTSAAHAIAPDTAPSAPITIWTPGTTPCTPTTCRNYAVSPVVQTPYPVCAGSDGYSYVATCH